MGNISKSSDVTSNAVASYFEACLLSEAPTINFASPAISSIHEQASITVVYMLQIYGWRGCLCLLLTNVKSR
jgi:hypothetical protein